MSTISTATTLNRMINYVNLRYTLIAAPTIDAMYAYMGTYYGYDVDEIDRAFVTGLSNGTLVIENGKDGDALVSVGAAVAFYSGAAF